MIIIENNIGFYTKYDITTCSIFKINRGLKFSHMGYAKLNLWQHLEISLTNRFLPWLFKTETLFKILTIILAIATIFKK